MGNDLNKFLDDYKISKDDFEKSEIELDELLKIVDDYNAYKIKLEEPSKDIINELSDSILDGIVHSSKIRIKETDKLVRKIIEKRNKKKKIITLNDYKTQVKDLIGIRVLHLLKEDFYTINEKINIWEFDEDPIMYHRKGDDVAVYEPLGIKTEEKSDHYRSVHYIIKLQPQKESFFAEIQVRTLIEEVWSAISHKLSYKSENKNDLIIQELNTINRICGALDEMCTNIFKHDTESKQKNSK